MRVRALVAITVSIPVALSGGACDRSGAGRDSVALRGDTVVVRAQSLERAVEPRVLARVVGDDSTIALGHVSAIAALANGGVVAFDEKNARGPVLLEFDSTGTFVRTIGRNGRGPGEYGTLFARLAALEDGTVFLYDDLNGRVHRYRGDTVLPPIPLPAMLRSGTAGTLFVARPDHSIITHGSIPAQRAVGAPLFIRFDSTGAIVDSLVVRERWMGAADTAAYAAWEYVVPYPRGGWVHVRTDRLAVLLRGLPEAPLLVAEVAAAAPWYKPEERRELERVEAWAAADRRAPRRIPERKALSQGGFVDPSGRIWVHRTADAVRIPPYVKYWDRRGQVHVSWGEPVVLSVFEPSGRYLGDWTFPVRAKVAAWGTTVWAVASEGTDAPTLIRYSLAP